MATYAVGACVWSPTSREPSRVDSLPEEINRSEVLTRARPPIRVRTLGLLFRASFRFASSGVARLLEANTETHRLWFSPPVCQCEIVCCCCPLCLLSPMVWAKELHFFSCTRKQVTILSPLAAQRNKADVFVDFFLVPYIWQRFNSE